MPVSQNQLAGAASIAQKHCKNLAALYLFGSMNTSYERKSSDIDIAILAKEKLTTASFVKIRENLICYFSKSVDLVDMHAASIVFCFELLKDAKRFYCVDKYYANMHETKVISLYLDFQDLRQPMVNDALKRGTIYGR